ncbi:MAG: RNA polymerase sigma factor [Syntrophomonadaceae bacterium]|jgi:DNA-directed RNA polymerase specialized sigma24 family protein
MRIEIRGAEKLSFRERQVVVLKEMGKNTDEIARQLQISTSTVSTLYHRARSKGYEVVIILSGDTLGLYNEEEDAVER